MPIGNNFKFENYAEKCEAGNIIIVQCMIVDSRDFIPLEIIKIEDTETKGNSDYTRIRKVTKRGYVYIGRANAGHDVEITIKPSAPKITAKAAVEAYET